VLKKSKTEDCLVEVFKHDCPSCAFNGKLFNVFSRKLKKHEYDLDCFRLSIDNKVPYLGNFGYSPIYFHVRKRGGEIVEISTLDPPQRFEEFIKGVEKCTRKKGMSEKIKMVPRQQILKFIRHED